MLCCVERVWRWAFAAAAVAVVVVALAAYALPLLLLRLPTVELQWVNCSNRMRFFQPPHTDRSALIAYACHMRVPMYVRMRVCVCALAICNALRVVRSKSANNYNNNRANKASALFLLNRIADAHENWKDSQRDGEGGKTKTIKRPAA